ncbi:head-tail connector protein [Rhodovulum tesquicola]|uniref:head-tail connector protein n=1 Tax=Rhodovulum tesquicola TaxID=540254 RepID=UPI0020968AC2|nr:head-tail connector protein [Rhodovulum tesquicola]MCO8146796.1 head-tail connector protein [Rhodovulum tesquicola]
MMRVQRFGSAPAAGAHLWEAKAHMRIEHNDEDAAIATMLGAATRDLEQYAGIALLTQTIRLGLSGWPSTGIINLPIGPVQNDASVTVLMKGQTFDWFRVLPSARAQLFLVGRWTPDLGAADLVIEYPAGFGTIEDVPEDLRLAVMDQVAALYDARGTGDPKTIAMSPHAARIAARYRGVRL